MKKELLLLPSKIIFCFLFFLCALTFVAHSQSGSVVITQTVPTSVNVCDSAQFIIKIQNITGNALTGMLLNVAMPGGVTYKGSLSSLPAAPPVLVSDISNLQSPIFSIPTVPAFNSIFVLFYANVDCGILAYQQQGNPILNTAKITYTNLTTDQNISATYNINAPTLVITTFTNQTYTGAVGTTFTRSITIKNSGTGALSSFTFTDIHGVQIDILSVAPGTLSGNITNDTVTVAGTDFAGIGDGDNLFENNESVTITETIKIIACVQPGVGSNITAYWGCGNQTACQTATTTANVIETPVGTPDLVITPSESSETCLDPLVARKQYLQIVNIGAGSANHIAMDIYQGSFTVPNNTYSTRIDENSFTFQTGINGNPIAIVVDSALLNSAFSCLGANPKYRIYLRIPVVINPITDTVYLKWNSYACCQAVSCSSFNTVVAPWEFQGKYTDACDSTVTYDIFPTSGGSIYGKFLNTSMTPEDMPTDVGDGSTTTFEHSATNWQNELDSAPGAYYQVEITIPPCFMIAPGPNPIRFRHSISGAFWMPTSPVTISGNVVTAVFATPDPFGVNGLSLASVLFDLTADCSICGDSGFAHPVSVNVKYDPDPSCAKPCLLDVYCNTSNVNLHCAGDCPDGGMAFLSYKMLRTSYGKPDNNNDGLPEVGSVNLAAIKDKRAMVGDTLTGYFRGVIDTSLAHLFFTNAYATASINNLGTYISFIDASVSIYDASTATVYNCSNVPPLSAAPNGANFDSDFDLSPLYLNTNGCSIPAGFVFEHNDSVFLNHRYRVTGNTGGPVVSSNSTTDFYASNIINPPPNPIPANKFSCDNYSGNYLSLYGFYFASDTVETYVTKSCNIPTIRNTNGMSIGPCCQNYGSNKFPFEYRPWANIDTIKVNLPAGYGYVSATVMGSGQTLTNISPTNPFANPLVFDMNALYSGGTWPDYSFDGYTNTIHVTLSPSCGVTNSTLNPIVYDEIHKKVPFIGGGNSTINFTDKIAFTSPQITLQSTLQTVNGINNIESWEITICNTSNNSNAFNTWIGLVSPNGNITPIDVTDVTTSAIIVPVNGIYKLGNRPFNTCNKYKIRFTYTACTLDSLIVNAGFNCIGYPDSLSAYPCSPKTHPLFVDPKPAALQMQIAGPSRDTTDLCDTVGYEVVLNSVLLSSVYNIVLAATLPSGLIVEPGTSEIIYPETPAVWTPISDPVSNKWYLSDSISLLTPNGLPGVNSPTADQIRIRFKVRPDCNFVSGSTVPFIATSKHICGLSLPTQFFTSGPLYIQGVEQLNISSMSVKMDSVHPCGTPSLVTVSIINVGPNPSVGNEHFNFPTFNGSSYVSGSFVGLHNPPPIGTPSIILLNGQNYMDWQFPVGVLPLDSVKFTFLITMHPDSVNCANILFPVKTTGSFSAICIADGSVCIIKAITDAEDLSVPVSLPCLTMVVLTATPTSETICSGDSTSIVLTSTVPGTTYSWTINQNGVTGATVDSGATIVQTLTTIGTVPGTVVYTVTPSANGCLGAPVTVTITVNPSDSGSFYYTSGTYCTSGLNQTPTITGLPGGTFTSIPSGLSINPSTGAIVLSTSSIGVYTVTYTTTGICPATNSVTITITNVTPSAVFSYTGSSYCPNGIDPLPVFGPGASAGTFSATPAGLVFVNVNTGEIDLSLSTPGTYTVINTIPASGTCLAATATSTITIALDDASFFYSSATYCQSGANPTPTITGLPGGIFSASPAGLSITASTGLISLTSSALGAYTLTYTTNGACPNTSSILMTITNVTPTATFSYSDSTFCQNDNNPVPIYPPGASAGFYTASPAGVVFVNVNTGEIDLSASVPGTYTVKNTIPVSGSCLAVIATTVITINPADDASFTYSSATYCTSGTNPSPTITGVPGGTFSATPAGLSINPSTGTIDLSTSTIGTYTLTYATNDSCPNTSSITMTIGNITPSATFSYSGLTFCQNGGNPLPIYTSGASAGTFSATPSGLVFVNANTGEINLSLSALGTYTVINTIPASGTCLAAVATTTVSIITDDASFTYTSATYCLSGTDPTPTITGLPGGTFSANPAGLSINPSTGVIDLSSSALGAYTLSYTTNGACSNTSSITMTIGNATPPSTFTYSAASFCQNGIDPLPVFASGASAGIFSASPVGLVFVHVNTGQIDLSGSAPGTYVVTNTIPASGTCAATASVTTVVINISDDASFNYTSGTYCQSGINQTPVITGLSGGTFSSSPSGLSINPATGEIDLATSALGSYAVTYTTNGLCSNTSSIVITIANTTPPATFSYSGSTYCQSGNNPLPIFAPGASAGTFSAVPAGLVFVNLNTGEVNLALSALGTYTVTNTIPTSGTCLATSAITTFTIGSDDANFTYSSGFFCQSGINPTPVITGLVGGAFSASPGGLVINPSTGIIDLSISSLGTYMLTYTTNGPCPASSSIIVTIGNVTPSAVFSYLGSPFCKNGTNPSPVTGSNFGQFSASPAGLVFVNLNTGEINLSLSQPGTYTITNTIPASGTCLAATATTSIVIIPADDASFVYTSATYCQSGANPTPTITGLAGGVFSSSPAGLSLNPTTGAINLALSSLNMYTLSYTTNGICPNTSTIVMTITNVTPSAAFTYTGSPFCQYGNNPFPNFGLGASAGIFSASPAGLVFVHVNTGQIDLGSSAPGTYTVTNNIPVSGTCLAATANYTITIDAAPVATATTASQNVCSGATVSMLLTSSVPGTTFAWTVSQTGVTGASGGVGSSISQVLTLSGTNQGSAIYTITSTANGCIGLPIILPFIINPLPVLDTTAVVITPANCNDTTGSIQGALVTSGQSPIQYEWKDSGGNIVGNSANLINAGPGNYILTTIDGNGCSASSGVYTITNTSVIVAAFTATPTTGETPLTVNFTNSSSNATNYLWAFGTGDTSTAVNPTYIYSPLGTFTVCLYADNGGNCVDTACSTIDIFVNSVFVIPNVFTPNGDGINDLFTLQTKGLKTLDVEIFNRWGQKINEWHTVNGGWDGRSSSGVICSDGTYYFIVNALGFDGKKYYEKGPFSLVH
ncbi:MAG: gliding motility-associated C-terminal domain-containing protein [Bacteroidota bacterium]